MVSPEKAHKLTEPMSLAFLQFTHTLVCLGQLRGVVMQFVAQQIIDTMGYKFRD